jgi:signal transduction histidine kinase
MVQDFLDWAQIRQGKFRKNVTRFDIRELVNKVMAIQQQKAEEIGIQLKAVFVNIEELGPDSPAHMHSPFVLTDEKRVMQVILGLQSNALKFTKRGSITIKVAIEQPDLEKADRFLAVEVQDTGVGIPAEDRGKLFKLFGFIENRNSVMNKNGIGLGLSIAKSIVTQFGGSIELKESVPAPLPNQGSVFKFTFKLE